jgi:hypothetical protein
MDPRLTKCWIFSHKDPDGTSVYNRRRKELQTPTDKSVELKSNGEFISHNPHSTGCSGIKKGRFVIDGHSIIVNFNNHYEDLIFSIIYYDDEVLKVRE